MSDLIWCAVFRWGYRISFGAQLSAEYFLYSTTLVCSAGSAHYVPHQVISSVWHYNHFFLSQVLLLDESFKVTSFWIFIHFNINSMTWQSCWEWSFTEPKREGIIIINRICSLFGVSNTDSNYQLCPKPRFLQKNPANFVFIHPELFSRKEK